MRAEQPDSPGAAEHGHPQQYEQAGEGVKRLGEVIVEGMSGQARKEIGGQIDAAEEFLRRHPVAVVAAALGVGLLTGMRLFR